MSSRSYLGLKSYHPARHKNQAKVCQAEREVQIESQREEERRSALEKEKRALESATTDVELARESVSFLYRAPPGYFRDREAEERADRQRKLQNPALLTLKDKFPEIKNAPMVSAEVVKSMDIRVNMLGKVFRNVQCTKCQAWGHKSGDRECSMKNVLRPADIERRDREDPLLAFQPAAALTNPASGLVLKESIVIRGGCDANSENQQLVAPGSDEDAVNSAQDAEPEVSFLQQLTTEQRAKLLRQLKKDRKRLRKRRASSSSSKHKRSRHDSSERDHK